ncbi:MAG: hypothetical protein IKX99_06895 [Lachnospiraceae bacterium]|nr:hypothetical protein [Lachnospiraceae bacterium]
MQINEIINTKTINNGMLPENIVNTKDEKVKESSFNMAPVNSFGKEGGLSFADIAAKSKMRMDKMTMNNAEFVAGTMDEEMAKALNDEGIDVEKDDAEVMLTVVDKINLQRAIGGADDIAVKNLSKEQLTAVSPYVARAYEMATELTAPTMEEAAYMIKNEMQPTIENIFKAENVMSKTQVKTEDITELKPAIEEKVRTFIENPTPDDIEFAEKIVKLGVELNEGTFILGKDLVSGDVIATDEEILVSINEAVSMGFNPQEAIGLKGYSYTDALKNIDDKELNSKLSLIGAKRRIVEASLILSEEANLTLCKKDMHIDTTGLQKIVEGLKDEEAALEKAMCGSVEGFGEFEKTVDLIDEIKASPAYAMPILNFSNTIPEIKEAIDNFVSTHSIGEKALDMAAASYDTMRTEIRPDLGDSIKKAFANVSDILSEMGMEDNAVNERAVRILGYNSMEITEEAVENIKVNDEKWQNVFNNLTPKVVLTMIREGYNPLNVELTELNDKAVELRERIGDTGTEKYSKFLYDLTKKDGITEEERESYMGIYRLLRQVEKTDGAVIGAAVASNAELTLKNLITEVRSRHTGHVDKRVDDELAASEKRVVADLSITEQVNSAYEAYALKNALEEINVEALVKMSEEMADGETILDKTPEEFVESLRLINSEIKEETKEEDIEAKTRLSESLKILETDEEVRDYLNTIEAPKSVENIEAVYNYFKFNKTYSKLYEEVNSLSKQDKFNFLKAEALKHFEENIESPTAMGEALEELEELATEVMDTMENEDEVSDVNLREMRLICGQIGLFADAAKKEDFAIPVLIKGKMGTVSLKIVKGKKEKGKVTITSHLPNDKDIAAEFKVQNGDIKGYFVTDDEELFDDMKDAEDRMKEMLSENEALKECNFSLDAIKSNTVSLSGFRKDAMKGLETPDSESNVLNESLYGIAKVFITVLKRS